jgi:flavin-dependent dehydrogenase
MQTFRFDVAIVGAGPAGSAAALALLRRGARVALIERRRKHEDRMGESLAGVASEALRELGVWESFQALEPQPSYVHRTAWGGRLEKRHNAWRRFGPDLHLDRARFDELLLEAARARGASVFRPASVRRPPSCAGSSRLIVSRESDAFELDARWLIDATGRAATLMRGFGAQRHAIDRLIGVARSFERGAREPATLVEAAADGWWYSAPQPGERVIALFVTDGDSPVRTARTEPNWSRWLESAPLTRRHLEGAAPLGASRSYLATPALLEWDLEQRAVPVGDAALSFDPIAAEGLCFALRSGIEAAAALLGARGSLAAYRDGVRRIFAAHLERRELIYASERKLRPTSFWQRARGPRARSSAL